MERRKASQDKREKLAAAVEAFIKEKYPSNKKWVKLNLELIRGWLDRKDLGLDERGVVTEAIDHAIFFAKNAGINRGDRHETDVLHIPSKLEAIKIFEGGFHPLVRQLTLSKIVEILGIAETTSVRANIGNYSDDIALQHLDNLKTLITFHGKLQRARL